MTRTKAYPKRFRRRCSSSVVVSGGTGGCRLPVAAGTPLPGPVGAVDPGSAGRIREPGGRRCPASPLPTRAGSRVPARRPADDVAGPRMGTLTTVAIVLGRLGWMSGEAAARVRFFGRECMACRNVSESGRGRPGGDAGRQVPDVLVRSSSTGRRPPRREHCRRERRRTSGRCSPRRARAREAHPDVPIPHSVERIRGITACSACGIGLDVCRR